MRTANASWSPDLACRTRSARDVNSLEGIGLLLGGERDIAVGNVVGSNIFNILGVMGLSALVAREGVPVSDALLGFDVPVMIAAAIACLPVFFTGHIIARWEGGLFLAYYAAYTTYLLLASTGHAALPTFTSSMVWFALPLTAVTLVVVTVRAARGRGPGP